MIDGNTFQYSLVEEYDNDSNYQLRYRQDEDYSQAWEIIILATDTNFHVDLFSDFRHLPIWKGSYGPCIASSIEMRPGAAKWSIAITGHFALYNLKHFHYENKIIQNEQNIILSHARVNEKGA